MLAYCVGAIAFLALLGGNVAAAVVPTSMVMHDGRRLVCRTDGEKKVYELVRDEGFAPGRPWRIYVVKATHTDIGLHNSQYIQRHGAVKRIEDAMRLVDADSRGDDDPAAYRYVMEGMWFWENYPMDRGEAAAWNVVSNYVRRGRIDIACGCAGNHTHVMGAEEIRRAALTKTRLWGKWGVPTRTMIMADNPGLSWSIVKPFAEAGMENLIFAPNQWNPIPSTIHKTNRAIPAPKWNPDARGGGNYIDVSYDSERPMVFRWESFDRSTNLLVWCSTAYGHGLERMGINGRGGELSAVEQKMPDFLAILERKYPYDLWLACNYGDDEEANTLFADFAAKWNAKWKYPQFVTVGRLDEPFDELRRRFGDRIPVVRGEMTSGWLQHVASTPELLAEKLEVERQLVCAEKAWRADPKRDASVGREIDRAWWHLILNDEHSYGTSGYQGRRVFETWMQHRDWIERNSELSVKGEGCPERVEVKNVGENAWYRVRVNEKGEIESIYDKDLGRELLNGTANRFLYTRDNHRTWANETLLGARIVRRVFLRTKEKRIDIEDTFEHARDLFNARRYYRYGYLAFPFAVPQGEFRARLGGGEVIDPYRDQSGYTTDAYVAVRDWCAVENDEFGIALYARDTMLTEFGEIHPDKTCFTGVPPKGKTAIYSYAFTDWLQMHVPDGEAMNFKFRYSIISYRRGEKPPYETTPAPQPVLTAANFPESGSDGWTGLIDRPRAGHGEKDGQMYLLWGADLSPQFDHYELWRDDGFLANVTNEVPLGIPYRVARFVDFDAGSHTTRTYRIRKVMKDGSKGAFSEPFAGQTRFGGDIPQKVDTPAAVGTARFKTMTPSQDAAEMLQHRNKPKSKAFADRFFPTYPSVCDVEKMAVREVPAFLRGAVMYQLFTRMFTPEGTFKAAERKLPELKDLGVDIIYLTPHQLADDDSDPKHWSTRQKACGFGNPKNPYRQKDFFAVDPEYGTAQDLKDFVSAAHRLGMKVMFDLVYFHCGPKAVFLDTHPEFIVRNADGSPRLGGWAFPEMDISRREVRDYLYSNMESFVRDYDVDGFRCDVADMLPVDFWEEGYLRCKALKPDIFMMCEGLKGDDQVQAFDLSYGFYTQWTIVELLKGTQPASMLRQAWEAQRRDYPRNFHWMRCFENHDFANVNPGERRKEALYGQSLNAAMIATIFLLDGIPMLYNGQEIADAAPHSIYSSREYGGWHIDWTKADEPFAVERRKLVKELAALRHEAPELFDAPVVWLETGVSDRAFAFRRDLAGRSLTLAVNVSKETVVIRIDGAELTVAPQAFVLLKN